MKLNLTILGLLALAGAASARPVEVQFAPTEIVEGEDGDGLRRTILDYWEAYQRQDRAGLLATLAPEVSRLCKQAGPPQRGRSQVATRLAEEWSAFEQRNGHMANQLTIRQASLRRTGNTAYATYWVESRGGRRWDYSDQALVYETLVQNHGQWQIAHHLESWSLDYDLDEERPGRPTVEFDYVYPVSQLPRALSFYKPIMGEPEWVSARSASFNLGGPRFQLRMDPLQGLALCRPGYPSGYAVFRVPDLQAVQKRLRTTSTQFLLGTDRQPRFQGPDPYVVVTDPAGNLLVLMERRSVSGDSRIQPGLRGFESQDRFVQAAGRVARAWMTTSVTSLRQMASPDCRWFDDRRTRNLGQQKGLPATLAALQNSYWPEYDRGPEGLQARLQVADLQVRLQPKGALVSYQAVLTGLGAHPFRERALVTQRFDLQARLVESFMISNDRPEGLVRDLDYTGYPVTDLGRSGDFYGKLMKLGEGYADTDYLGWWSNFAVFGIYLASPAEDGLPLAGRANGYASFWVASAQQALQYAQKHRCRFPVLPAITGNAGISSEPGYRQLYTTDSEGNGLLFTEYH